VFYSSLAQFPHIKPAVQLYTQQLFPATCYSAVAFYTLLLA